MKMNNVEEVKIIKNRITEIELITEPLLLEKELLRKKIIRKNNEYSNWEILKYKFKHFIVNQKDIPVEYVDIINKNFWDLIGK